MISLRTSSCSPPHFFGLKPPVTYGPAMMPTSVAMTASPMKILSLMKRENRPNWEKEIS